MRKFFFFLRYIPIFFLICTAANAQIAVTKSGTAVTVPALAASYTSLSNALTALNSITSYTTPGTIIFTCAAGSSETAPATGFVIGSATLNPLLSATNTVTIIKASGTVTINAGVGTATPASLAPDGMISIRGADYITIDGFSSHIAPISVEDLEALKQITLDEAELKHEFRIAHWLRGMRGHTLVKEHIFGPTCTICTLRSRYRCERGA